MGVKEMEFDSVRRRGRIEVRLRALRMGHDLLVALDGGDRPHIGAVAVSQPRPEAAAGHPATSLIALLGHREEQLAQQTAARIARRCGIVATVACGIHHQAISRAEIETVLALAGELTEACIAWLDRGSRNAESERSSSLSPEEEGGGS